MTGYNPHANLLINREGSPRDVSENAYRTGSGSLRESVQHLKSNGLYSLLDGSMWRFSQ